MRDARSAILVGTVYAGATVYHLLALLTIGWRRRPVWKASSPSRLCCCWPSSSIDHRPPLAPDDPALVACVLCTAVLRPHLFRLEGGWRRLPRSDQTQISRAAAVWLTARGLLYAMSSRRARPRRGME